MKYSTSRIISLYVRFASSKVKNLLEILFIFSNFSKVKSPSSVGEISLKRKYLTASAPYFSANQNGSITFPKLLDIFWPPTVIKPWTNIVFGNSKPKEKSIAGQIKA